MYGWRGRIGLILPMENAVLEPELYSLGLPGISYHSVRLTTKERRRIPDQAIVLAPVLIETGAELIIYACAEPSYIDDADDELRVASEIQAATGRPCVTLQSAIHDALRVLSVKRIALVSTHTPVHAHVMQERLVRRGFDIVHGAQPDFGAEGIDPAERLRTHEQPPHAAYRMARQADVPEAEAVLINTTNLPTVDMIDRLEADLQKPVVSANQALLWRALRQIGVNAPIPGCGQLLRTLDRRGISEWGS